MKKLLTQEEKNSEFIKKAKLVHNNKYNYDKVQYIKSSEKVCIICSEHGEFWQTPNNHLRGTECPKCKYKKQTEQFSLGKDKFIEKARQIHGNKYDYNKVNYVNNRTKVIITCSIHGDFEQTPHEHLQGCGCSKCNGGIKYTKDDFINKSILIHGDKYDYSKVNYINSQSKVIITCPEHGDFEQRPVDHLRGHGCSRCKLKSQSKFYEKLKKIFYKEDILFEVNNKLISWLENQRFDIYFPKYNIAIEYNGEQHYVPIKYFGGEIKFKETQQRDELKRQKCIKNNCVLFEIKYNYTESDFNTLIININNIIKNYESNSQKQ